MHKNLPPLFIYKHAHVLSYLVLFFSKFRGGEVTLFIGYPKFIYLYGIYLYITTVLQLKSK